MTATQILHRPLRWRGWLAAALMLMVAGALALAPARAGAMDNDGNCGGSLCVGDDGDQSDTGYGGGYDGDFDGTDGYDNGYDNHRSYDGDDGAPRSYDDPGGNDGPGGGEHNGGFDGGYDEPGGDSYGGIPDSRQEEFGTPGNNDRSVNPFPLEPAHYSPGPVDLSTNPFRGETPTFLADPKMLDDIEQQRALEDARLPYPPYKAPALSPIPKSGESKAATPTKAPTLRMAKVPVKKAKKPVKKAKKH
jgi:hypothetical protein